MSETKITKHYFKYGTLKYFRGGAENVEMGSFGEKKDPIGAKAYLAVEGRVNRKHLEDRVNYVTTVTVDWSKQSKADVEANGALKVFGIGAKGAAQVSFAHAKTANLKLAKFVINERPLRLMLNEDADVARQYLAKEGKDGRIVSAIWVVMEAKLADHFELAGQGGVDATVANGELEISAKVGSSRKETITISSGTTFAYAMHKVKDWNRDKTKIEDMEDDYKGLG